MSFTTTLRVRANVRRGGAGRQFPAVRTLDAGSQIEVAELVEGESVAGEARWCHISADEYIWAGGCVLPAGLEAEADPNADRPNRAMLGDTAPPRFQTAAGIRHVARGRRPNGLEGAIVHFDAYRFRRAGNGAEDSDNRSLDTLRSGQANGYHYCVISRTGTIFLPEGFDWQQWGYHAGPSVCPLTGRSGVSQFYVGFEMNNPGVVYPAQEEGVFCPWFNSVRDANGMVKLDARGRCTRVSAKDEWYSADEVRQAEGGNIHKNWYVPYSYDQFEALTNALLYLAGRFSSFSLKKVFGHDEVAPMRKSDPGGALANPDTVMKMADFRALLAEKL